MMKKNTQLTVELSIEEYRDLLALAYLGDTVAQLQHEQTATAVERKRYRALYAKLAKLDQPTALSGCFIYDEKHPEGYPTPAYADKVCNMLDCYKTEVFWEELIERLAKRDAMIELNLKKIPTPSAGKALWAQWYALFQKYEDAYTREFERIGIEKLFSHETKSALKHHNQHYLH